MADYKTKCPCCNGGPLRLYTCVVRYDKGPLLEDDGFHLGSGSGVATSDEVFECMNCGQLIDLWDLFDDEEE